MKLSFMVFTFIINSTLYSQAFHGEYISHKTSFKDEINPEKSFIEENQNNILIIFEIDIHHGIFVFQDSKIPDNILSYEVFDFEDKVKENDLIAYIFNCKPLHINSLTKTQIVMYYDKEGNLNIMISDDNSSQVFHDLILLE